MAQPQTSTDSPDQQIIDPQLSQAQLLLKGKIETMQSNGEVELRKVENQDIVLFLGATGSGKSTTLDYLYGVELEKVFDFASMTDIIRPKAGQTAVADIGHGGTSKTLFPQIIPSQELGLTFCDTPGFRDNRGPEYDIAGAFMIKSVAARAKSLKCIIFVCNFGSLTANRGEGIRDSLSHLASILGNVSAFENNIIFAFNRYPPQLNSSIISQNLRGMILGSSGTQHTSQLKDLVNILCANNGSNIWLSDVVDHSARPAITNRIKACTPMVSATLNYTISDASALLLRQMADQDKYEISCFANQLRGLVRQYWTQKVNSFKGSAQLNLVKSSLQDVKDYLKKLLEIQANPNEDENDVAAMARSLHLTTPGTEALIEKIEATEKRLKWIKVNVPVIKTATPLSTSLIAVEINDCEKVIDLLHGVMLDKFYLLALKEFLLTFAIQSRANSLKTQLLPTISTASSAAMFALLPGIDSVSVAGGGSLTAELGNLPDEVVASSVRGVITTCLMQNIQVPSLADVRASSGVALMNVSTGNVALSQVVEAATSLLQAAGTDLTEFRLVLSGTLFADRDLEATLFGSKNVTIVCKELQRMNTTWKVDVSGANGAPYPSTDLHDGTNASVHADSGKHAGNILIVTGTFATDHCTFSANGGNGAGGQDGRNGAPGANGVSGQNAQQPEAFPDIMSFSSYGVTIIADKDRFNAGTNGTAGGDGGAGGNASFGGTAGSRGMIVLAHSDMVTLHKNYGTAGIPGQNGTPGTGGTGGKGGRNGYSIYGHKSDTFHKSIWYTGYFSWPVSGVVSQPYNKHVGGDLAPGGPDPTFAADGASGTDGSVTLAARSVPAQVAPQSLDSMSKLVSWSA